MVADSSLTPNCHVLAISQGLPGGAIEQFPGEYCLFRWAFMGMRCRCSPWQKKWLQGDWMISRCVSLFVSFLRVYVGCCVCTRRTYRATTLQSLKSSKSYRELVVSASAAGNYVGCVGLLAFARWSERVSGNQHTCIPVGLTAVVVEVDVQSRALTVCFVRE